MQHKLPLEYGPREAKILRNLTETQKLPSKNEGFRRGIVATEYLMDADRGLLFEVLVSLLNQASEGLNDMSTFPRKLEVCKTLASEIEATYAVQKGIESADSIDIFRADLDNYLVLAQTKGFEGADKKKVATRLRALSEVARQFAKKESGTRRTESTISEILFREV